MGLSVTKSQQPNFSGINGFMDMVGPFHLSSLQGFFIQLLKISKILSDQVVRVELRFISSSLDVCWKIRPLLFSIEVKIFALNPSLSTGGMWRLSRRKREVS
jgi:hypothetical protein